MELNDAHREMVVLALPAVAIVRLGGVCSAGIRNPDVIGNGEESCIEFS